MSFTLWRPLSLIPFLVAFFCIWQQCANGEDVVVNFPNQMTVTGTVTAEIQPDLQYLPDDIVDDYVAPSRFTQNDGGSLTSSPSAFSSRLNLSYLVFDEQQITDTPNTSFSYNSGTDNVGGNGRDTYSSNVTFRLFKCHFDWEAYFDDLNEVFFGQGGVDSADLLLKAPAFSRASNADYSYNFTFPFTGRQITLKIPFSWFGRGGSWYSLSMFSYYMSRWLMDMALVWSMIWVVFKFQ